MATAIGSAGLAAGGTAGALLGADLVGTSAGAGLPIGLLVLGSAAGALLVSRLAGQGRRGLGLVVGYLLGVAGAAAVVGAVEWRSLTLLLAGSTVLGAANSAIFLTRYAALDAVAEPDRGRALGTVFFATAVGAVVSPMLLGPGGALAEAVGLPRLSGLYLVAAVAFLGSALLLAAGSNARLPWFGRAASVLSRPGGPAASVRDILGELRNPSTAVAMTALAAANFVMVGIMAIAPVHMLAAGHSLSVIGAFIALHVAGMFAPSPVSGFMADRYGPGAVMVFGFCLLFASTVTGLFIDHHAAAGEMAVNLVIIGVGWNCAVVGASAALGSAVRDSLRPHVEGLGEVVMGLAAGVAAPVAGVVAALSGYRAFSILCAVVVASALIIIRRRPKRPRFK